MIYMVRKITPRFTKFPRLVLIGLVLTEIQAFKNVKNLQRNVWKTGQISKFQRFLFPFSSKFSDLNFASDVLYNLPVICYV